MGATIIAASVDTLEQAQEVVGQGLTFPVAYGVTQEESESCGAWWSDTSRYGTITRSQRYAEMEPLLRQRMQETIEEIRSGAFAREWSSDREAKLEMLEKVRAVQANLPMTKWEDATRRAFRIGARAKDR